MKELDDIKTKVNILKVKIKETTALIKVLFHMPNQIAIKINTVAIS